MAKSAYDKLNDLSDAWETEDIMEVVEESQNDIQGSYNQLEEIKNNLADIYDRFEKETIEDIKDAIGIAIDEIEKVRKDLY